MSGPEQVLVEDWCGQYQTHSVGTAAFGSDGALYASGGEGAGATFTDYGQFGNPLNPCGDPPGGVGATLTPPSAEGGALRSQDLRTLERSRGSRRNDHPRRSAHRRRAGEQPVRGKLGRQRAPGHRLRAAQSLPLRLSPGDERALGRRRRRDRLGGDQSHRQPGGRDGRELRLAVLRGSGAPVQLRRRRLHPLREPVRPGGSRHQPVLHVQPRRAGRRRRELPDRLILGLGHGLRAQLRGERLSERLSRSALLRRLLA